MLKKSNFWLQFIRSIELAKSGDSRLRKGNDRKILRSWELNKIWNVKAQVLP